MNETYNRLLTEQINEAIDSLDVKDGASVKSLMTELFNMTTNKLMSNIGSVEADDNSNEIATENWDMLLDSISKAMDNNPKAWLDMFKDIKLRILTFKFFTKNDLIKMESIEQTLRMDIKPFFTALQNYSDYDSFSTKFFLLPSELLMNFVRYLINVEDSLKELLKVTSADLKKVVEDQQNLRLYVAEKIAKVSRGYQTILDINELKELHNNGVLFEDNFVNRGINEFIVKLLNHVSAFDALKDNFPGAMLNDLKKQAETSASYIAHVKAIRNETGFEYFSVNGEQVGNRFESEIEVVKKKDFTGYIVDKDSRFKEPNDRITNTMKPWESADGMPEDGSTGRPPAGSEGGSGKKKKSGGGGGGGLGSITGLGNADFGDEFADDGEEGKVPGAETGIEADGIPVGDGDGDGLPDEFGTEEDNTEPPADDSGSDDKMEK